jgi:hypothetical protein
MTEARLVIDPTSISLRSVGPATGDIALVLGDIAFPAEAWNDFVLVVLEAWLSALTRILRHLSDAERVHFMEGPYSVDITRLSKGAIQVRALQRPNQPRAVAEVMPIALVKDAIAAADGVVAFCRMHDHSSTDLDRLKTALAVLRQEVLTSTN